MKRIFFIIVVLVITFSLAACGEDKQAEQQPKEEKGCEIAVIAEGPDVGNVTVSHTAWKSVRSFADENGIAAGMYEPEEATKEKYIAAIQQAVDDGAKLVVLPGAGFETTAYQAQSAYADVDFLLIDGVPHDENNTYATAANTIGIIFAEEEAGYMAGYAAVKEGYDKLGFMGGQVIPEIKRYGYGFVQGAAAAAAETETKVEVNYKYTGTSAASDDAEALAAGWYKNGTQVIFACGGNLSSSVIKASEASKGKVIGSDIDQSSLSENVITSAEKGIDAAVETVLKSYAGEKFVGGTAFNYAAKNDGVMLETENAGFQNFSEEEYKKLFRQLKNGKIELKKDNVVKSVSELAGEWVTIKEQ